MRDGEEYDRDRFILDCIQDGGRRPPLLPSAFAAELETKSFTNGKDDKPLVKRLYEAAFQEQFGEATSLNYGALGWGDAKAAQLAEVLASGAAPRLKVLQLSGNKIGDEGFKALAAALKDGWFVKGAAPSLKARDATPRHTPPSPAECPSRLPSRADALGGQHEQAARAGGRVRGARHRAALSLSTAGRQGRGARRDRRASSAESNRPCGCGARRTATVRARGCGCGCVRWGARPRAARVVQTLLQPSQNRVNLGYLAKLRNFSWSLFSAKSPM